MAEKKQQDLDAGKDDAQEQGPTVVPQKIVIEIKAPKSIEIEIASGKGSQPVATGDVHALAFELMLQLAPVTINSFEASHVADLAYNHAVEYVKRGKKFDEEQAAEKEPALV